ncbi:MAG: mechanosensitive ion channel [Candidatus Woesearchaeota archaeon]|nr:MAG: mechanosensitive ion channel [Candidatus Woesearchaeota archaeon]
MVDILSLEEARITIKIVAAIIILLIGIIIGRFLGKLLTRVFKELEVNKLLRKSKINLPLTKWISDLVQYGIYIIAFFTALNQIGLFNTVLNIIVVNLIVFAIVIGLLFIKDIIPNLMASFYLGKAKLKVGDIIKVENMKGKVMEFGFVDLKIKTRAGDIIFIPNSYLLRKKFVKSSF